MDYQPHTICSRTQAGERRSPAAGAQNATLRQGDLVFFAEGDDGFFPVGSAALEGGAAAAGFATDVEGVDLEDLDFEKLLNGLADVRFVGAPVGHDGVLVVFFRLARALLGYTDGFDDFK